MQPQQSLVVFDFHDNPVRTVMIDGEPWFVAQDVCRCLGIEKYRDAVARLADDEKGGPVVVDTLGGQQGMTVLNEPGAYRLIFESRKPEADRFRRWVFHEVLPALRKTGRYGMDDAEIDRMKEKLSLVREARLTIGRVAARELWAKLGLPLGDDGKAKPSGQKPEGLAAYVADFLEEMTEQDANSRVRPNALHDAYLEWSRLNKAPYIMLHVFGKLLVQIGLKRIKSNGLPLYLGIRIKPGASRPVAR
mgnify:CR=1 FL=1